MYDVIVVGAGPAGSTCARTCAQQGLRTLLLDKDAFPRSKPCAGAVSAVALSHLDFSLPKDIIENECFGVRVHHSKRAVEVRHERRLAVLVNRKNFDALLADKAVESGALFAADEQVVAIREKQEAVEIITRTQAHQGRFLIGADGIHSIVARALRPALSKSEMALALVSQTPADDLEINGRLDKILDVYFGEAPVGYGWLFPHRGYYSLGIAGLASRFVEPRNAISYLADALKVSIVDVRGHFIPFGGINRPVARGRIFLAGDAAGFADPFHGEGIAHAILSGRLAAIAVVSALKNGKTPPYAVAQYCRETDLKISKQLRVALRLAKFLDKQPRIFHRIFFDHPKALRRFLDIPAGQIDYQQFQRWILARLPSLLLPVRRRKPAIE